MKFLSHIVTAVSGSIGGTTYAHNQGGMYMRARATPTNPNTARQQTVRAALAAMVTEWSTVLTAAERAAWDTYAANVPVTNPLGQSINLSGQQMYLRQAIPQQQFGLTINAVAPVIFDLGQPIVVINSIVVAGGVLTWDFDVGGAGTSDTGYKIFQVGAPQNAGRNFFKGPYQISTVTTIAAATQNDTLDQTLATPTDWLADYIPDVGDRLPVRMRIHYDDGRVSMPFSEIVTVA